MRTKIFSVRGNMTAQRPGAGLSPSTLDGRRSWVFYDKHIGYDYLTQLPTGERELMFGGGFFQGGDDGLSELGTFDDSKINAGIAAHLSGSLPLLFGNINWGTEAVPHPLPQVHQRPSHGPSHSPMRRSVPVSALRGGHTPPATPHGPSHALSNRTSQGPVG